MPDQNPLEQELAAFERTKGELLASHKGKFVLIKGDQIHGTFTTEAEAYEAGVKAFGAGPFLVRQVTEDAQAATMPALFSGLLHATF
jgi:hypothetical protein